MRNRNCNKFTILMENIIKFMKLHKLEGTKFFRAFEEIAKDIAKINLYDIKDYHTSEIRDFFRLRIGKYRAIFKKCLYRCFSKK